VNAYYDERETRSADQRHNELTQGILAQLSHAQAHAPAYANLEIDQITSLDDLEKLPVTRKSALIELQQQNPPFGGFAAITDAPLQQVFVSPGPIFEPQTGRKDYWRFARSLYAAGIRPGDLVHNTFSYHMTPAGSMFNTACQALGAISIAGGVGQSDQQVEAIDRLQPSGFCGTPSFLKILLDKAEQMNTDIKCIKNALVSGEAFPPAIRESFKARGISALQCYGTADLGLIAYESAADSGFILDEDVFVEIVTPGTGDCVPSGEVGELVVTTLNPDYPLIRFATGDLSAFAEGTSHCGRTNTRIKGWMGRADQTAKVRGMFIHPEQIAQIVTNHPEVSKARLVIDWVDQSDTMVLRCETDVMDASLSQGIADSIRNLCKVRGEVELVPKGSLPSDGIVIEDIRNYS